MRNVAVGGAASGDLAGEAEAAGIGPNDGVVVSVGTNDAAPWKGTQLSAFEADLTTLVTTQSPRRWVYLAPPGVDEVRLTGTGDRTNDLVTAYRECAASVGRHAVRLSA